MTSLIRKHRRDLRDLLLSILFFVLAYAPSPLGFLIYIAFIPQIYLYRRHHPQKAFLFGYLIGLVVNMVILYWILLYNGLGYSIIILGNALQFAVFAGIYSFLDKINEKYALFSFPFFWSFLEYTRQFGDLAFNWLNIAHTQTYYLPLIQYLDLTGYLGVVFWICILNVVLYLLWTNRRSKISIIKSVVTIFILFLLPLMYGFYKLSEKQTARGVSVAYIQPNIDPDLKWGKSFKRENLRILVALTDSILVTGPDLVIWPETGIPYYLGDVKEDQEYLYYHTTHNNYHLLTGAVDKSQKNGIIHEYNASYFFIPGDSLYSIYRKLRLVPVEEAIPYQNVLSDWSVGIPDSLLTPGDEPVVFKMHTYPYQLNYTGNDWRVINRLNSKVLSRIASVICYESIFPNLIQNFYQLDSDLLVIITNDAWFGYTPQPFQHMQIAVLRAIEQRCSVIRCANSGISSFIDPYGRGFFNSQIFEKTLAQKIVPLRLESTIYAQYGDWVGIFCGIFIFSFLTLLVLGRKRII